MGHLTGGLAAATLLLLAGANQSAERALPGAARLEETPFYDFTFGSPLADWAASRVRKDGHGCMYPGVKRTALPAGSARPGPHGTWEARVRGTWWTMMPGIILASPSPDGQSYLWTWPGEEGAPHVVCFSPPLMT